MEAPLFSNFDLLHFPGMQKRTIHKYEDLIKQYKKDYLGYKRLLKRRERNHDYNISTIEYKNGKKKVYPVDEYKISSIIHFSLQIQNYKLALKNLKWVYLNTTPYKRPFISNIEAAFIWYKNNKLTEADNILQLAFKQEPRYLKSFNLEPFIGTLKADGGFTFQDHIEAQISHVRAILAHPEYAGFVAWGKQ